MEYPKDRCAFCEHTTRNAPVVTKEYLESLKATDDHLDLVLDVDQVLSENYDVFFGAIPPVVVVGIDGVSSDFGDFDSGQFLLIFNTLL